MEAVEFFTSTQKRVGQWKEQCRESLKALERTSYNTGLQANEITQLVDVIGERKFSDYVSRRLVRLLIPVYKIDVDSVIHAVSWICTRTLSLSIQIDLLKWIVAFYDFIDNKNDFHALYGVIFSFLASDALCPVICCLLHLMTLKEDVLPNRVRYLISLQNKVGTHPYLTALLSLYHSYKPNMMVLKYQSQRKKVDNLFHLLTSTFRKLYEKARSFQSKVSIDSSLRKSIVVEIFDIKNYCILEETLHLVQLPGAIEMVLKSPLRRLYLTSCKEALLMQLQFWICASAHDEIMSSHKSKTEELLQLVIAMADELQEEFPVISLFLHNSVALWNKFFSLGLSLLEYMPFCKTSEASCNIHEMLRHSSVKYKCSAIRSLMQLYLNWHVVEIHRQRWRLRQESDALDLDEILTTFHNDSSTECQPEDAVLQLTSYINKLITFALYMHPDCHPLILHYAFLFYNMVLDICEQQTAVIIPPAKAIIYCSLFSCNSFALTRICHLMARYRNVITTMKSRGQAQHLTNVISTVNAYIVDISDALWLCKTFAKNRTSVFCMQDMPLSVINSVSSINDQFSLYHHPALVWLVKEFVSISAGGKFDLAENILSDLNMRNAFLEVLNKKNVNGLVSFVNTFIRQKIHSA